MSLAGVGSPSAAIEDALHRRQALLGKDDRAYMELRDLQRVKQFRGDFAGAEAEVKAMQALRADAANLSMHERHADALIDIYTETNQPKKACAVAREMLERAPALTHGAIPWQSDLGLYMSWVLARNGCIPRADYVVRRQEYAAAFRERMRKSGMSTSSVDQQIWGVAYVGHAWTRAEAEEALAELDKIGVKPAAVASNPTSAGLLGRLYSMAGRHEEAIPFLRMGVTPCLDLTNVFINTAFHWHLGQSLEARGDIAGARAEYQLIVKRWGSARPPPKTAGDAMARLQVLK